MARKVNIKRIDRSKLLRALNNAVQGQPRMSLAAATALIRRRKSAGKRLKFDLGGVSVDLTGRHFDPTAFDQRATKTAKKIVRDLRRTSKSPRKGRRRGRLRWFPF